MNQNTETSLSNRQQIVTEANHNWNLQQLYQHIESIKLQRQKAPLTPLEKVCLEGMFCGYTPEKISQALPEELDYYSVKSTFWNLYGYIKIMTGRDNKEITNYQDVIDSLDSSRYQPGNAITIAAVAESTEDFPLTQISENLGITSIVPQSQQVKPASVNHHHELVQVDENDFMPAMSLWTRLGGLILAGSVGLAIALSAVTSYKVTVKANAAIRPDGKIKVVQAETPGTIVSIQAQENQTIKQGDVIATIDGSSLETETNLLQNQIQQAELQRKQIAAQISALNQQILAETERINNSIAEAEAELNRTRRNFRDRKITSSAQVQEAKANLRSIEAALNAARTKQQRYQSIAEEGVISENLLEEAKLEVQQQEQAIAAAKARLYNVVAALNPSDAEIAIAQKRITQAKASGEATLAALNREREVLKQQAIDTQKQLERYQRQLKQALRNSDRATIKAPTNGTLFQLNLRNSGQNVQSGTEIAKIAPENTSLLAKAYVKPQDINQVTIGQPAQLRISACPYPDYGTLKGKVTQVSPDAIPTQGNPAQDNTANSQGLYEVTIQPESLTLSQGNNKCALQLGMEGKADIIAQEETVLTFILRKAKLMANL